MYNEHEDEFSVSGLSKSGLSKSGLAASGLLTQPIAKTIHGAQERGMLQPLLLFLAGHRPVAFVAGQLLHLGSPVGAIVGLTAMSDWADLLSHPDGPFVLERTLAARQE